MFWSRVMEMFCVKDGAEDAGASGGGYLFYIAEGGAGRDS